MSKEKERIWVHPSFKKEIKKKAADEGINVIQYTKLLSKNLEEKTDEKKIFSLRF